MAQEQYKGPIPGEAFEDRAQRASARAFEAAAGIEEALQDIGRMEVDLAEARQSLEEEEKKSPRIRDEQLIRRLGEYVAKTDALIRHAKDWVKSIRGEKASLVDRLAEAHVWAIEAARLKKEAAKAAEKEGIRPPEKRLEPPSIN